MLSRTANSVQKGQKSILLIENNPTIQELLVYLFTLSEYRCSILDERSITSLNWIENITQTPPDAIVLDIDIHTSSFRGPLDFLHACNEAWQRTDLQMRPLLLLTTQVERRAQLQQEGYIVITKPFKPSNLLSEMQMVIERKQEGGGVVEKIVSSVCS